MELGAVVCTPRAPRCAGCPLARRCLARREGCAEALPVKTPKRPRARVEIACACVVRGGRVLLVRRAEGLLAGTWSLPELAVDGVGRERAARAAARGAGVAVAGLDYRGEVRHVFTHRDVTAHVFQVVPRAGSRATAADARRWVDPGALGALGISTFARKTLLVGVGNISKRDKRVV